ncbi:hypothetical protein H4P12_02715 [Paracoccus sp. 11-3]|uniref:Uncharacterized protein n=1 Tax=Paracoccus amoyensis TaxID=2760093 RepID=A0A926JCC5_9RHOB|nr:hypothetical protein [Paracoccus amoyensis]MBC9245648.1 hypothetical protein [Paracoccus amoyensis]
MTGIGTELLGVIAVGIGAAAVLYALQHLLSKMGIALPRRSLPAGIGLAMVIYSVWNDYAWHDRTVARLPEGVQILLVGHDSQPWAPWSYIWPVPVRIAALDPSRITETESGIRRAQIMLMDRRAPVLLVPQDFDCQQRLIRPANGDWATVSQDDPAFAAVCEIALPG